MRSMLMMLALLCASLMSAEEAAAATDTDLAKPAETAAAKPYTLTTCIVSGEDLDADAVTIVHEGQEVKFCCKKCGKKFAKDPATYLAKLAPVAVPAPAPAPAPKTE